MEDIVEILLVGMGCENMDCFWLVFDGGVEKDIILFIVLMLLSNFGLCGWVLVVDKVDVGIKRE